MPVYSTPQSKLDTFIGDFHARPSAETSGTHVVMVYEKSLADFPDRPDGGSPVVAIVLMGPLTEEQRRLARDLMYTVRR